MEYEIKDIEGYEGLYEVDNQGNVFSLNYNRTGERRKMKGGIDTKGYFYVRLCKDGKVKNYLIHRLVAEAFIPNPNNYLVINHKDENPSNNLVENLEWCTYSYNTLYSGNHIKGGEATKLPSRVY